MSYLVDTSVWSLALRRDVPDSSREVAELKRALETGGEILVTGLVLQELLQGFNKPKACTRKGIQTGTIDALLASLCIERDIQILTADKDFSQIAKVSSLKVWS
jgi:predicted nucleic acid-binding protein